MDYTLKKKAQDLITNRLLVFFIFIHLFLPKINLFEIPGYTQGIRFENCLSFLMLITLIVTKNLTLYDKDVKNLSPFFYFIIITIISCYVGLVNGLSIQIIFIIRLFEYLAFYILLFKSEINLKIIENLIKYFLIVCLVGIALQYFKLMGTFTSSGYHPDYFALYTAFTSGSWELSFMTCLSFFTLLSLCKNDKKKLIIYFICSLIIISFAKTRGVGIAFIFSILVYLYAKDRLINLKIFFCAILILITVFSILEFTTSDLNYTSVKSNFGDTSFVRANLFSNIMSLDIKYIYLLFKNFFIHGDVASTGEVPFEYLSLQVRLIWWNHARDDFLLNSFTILFGSGPKFIYYESFIFRVIFTFGLIGTLIILYIAIRRVPLYLLSFYSISGLTTDFIASYKLAIATIILHYAYTFYNKNIIK